MPNAQQTGPDSARTGGSAQQAGSGAPVRPDPVAPVDKRRFPGPGFGSPERAERDRRDGRPARGRRPGEGPGHKGALTLTRGQFIGALAAAAVAAAVPTALVASCASRSATSPGTSEEERGWISRYDWDDLVTLSNGFLAYMQDGQVMSEAGVDVSEYDGQIDWAQVKASGAQFAMVRLGNRGYTLGSISLDSYFLANLSGASSAGLKVGAYFFSQAISAAEAREEARFVVDTLAATGVALSYPVVFDEEPITNGDAARTDGMTDEQYTANALAFCQEVEAAGYTPMVYGNQHDLARLDLAGSLASYEVWYAEYGVSRPTGQVDFSMWQYSSSGTVGGFSSSNGQVDLNIRFLTSGS